MNTAPARLAAALAVPLLALAACSSGASDSSDGSSSGSARAASDPGGGSSSLLSHASGDTAGETAGDTAGAKAADGATASKADGAAQPVEQPSIISTGSVSLSTEDVARTRTAVQHVADAYAGQVTDQETTVSDHQELGYARMVLRVPARSFSQAVADLEQVADLVDSTTKSVDVSTQVVDTDERVKAARASIDRIRTLLARAVNIGDVMAIESQLAGREADLNSLLRQQAHLADQTALSTITVSIDRAASRAHPREATDDTGFLAGLRSGWGALRGFATAAATVLGALLPWTPLIVLVGVPAWLALRRARRAQAVPAVSATSAEG
ncbi:DUF4349 domain-containing protein [Nocardioides terrae]|nr:DUF4349 domain-containing protein [Nocardioides terrae]